MKSYFKTAFLFSISFLALNEIFAQVDTSYINGLDYRGIGPYRGGRSCAVVGVPSNPNLFYFGGTGGGVWKSENAGTTWKNISDKFFGGSIGAVAVSTWDPNVIYVGTGEETVRGNVSSGNGIWKSEDAGKTWKHIGLEDSRHITRIAIDPKNPDLVYASCLGHLYGPNSMRGIFRSKDGGKNWEKVLFVNDEVGTIDLNMDPTNSRILFTSMWKVKRTPYSLESGGEGSSLWKSIDGGTTWKNISSNKGLPKGTLGIIGVSVPKADPRRVYAIIEAEEGGVFRSDDGGENWIKINEDRNLRQRAWYYSRIYADPKDKDKVYVLNVGFWRSKDGGKSFEEIGTPHGDHHDLWINPENPDAMIIGDDGGAQVTVDGAKSWSSMNNQPTAQFYRVTTDNNFPYRIYGAQQDNSTVRIFHRTEGGSIGERDWETTAGFESGWIAVDPKDNDIVYGGNYAGLIGMINHRTKENRTVDVWPNSPIGHGAKEWKYRFQWNFPLLFSKHDSSTLYAAGNILFKTTNAGQTWQAISGDLTRNDTTKLGSSGGPITKDNTGVEYYCTIFTLAESSIKPGIIWTGSDDGLIYVTADGGKNWKNVTPPINLLPEWAQINSIEANPFVEGGLYVAATRYKSDDYKPYLLKTTDFGKTWKKIVNGIAEKHFTRVVRADNKRQGLLFAGTEEGMYISFNDGENWQTYQQNLPIVPITDLTIKNEDLIVATQGRSFWMIDDFSPLRQINSDVTKNNIWFYPPRETFRIGGGGRGDGTTSGINLQGGVILNYFFKEMPDSNTTELSILDSNGKVIRTYKPKSKERGERLPIKKGLNRMIWNMRYPDAERFDGMILWNGGGMTGPLAVTGNYKAILKYGKDSSVVSFTIVKDPRSSSSVGDIQAQFDFLISVRDKLSETHNAIKQIRNIRKQIKDVGDRIKDQKNVEVVKKTSDDINKKLTAIEETLYQTKNKSSQDPLNYPIRLNDKLSALGESLSNGNYKPTDQAVKLKEEFFINIDAELLKLKDVIENEIPKFNKLVAEANVPAVVLQKEEEKK
ncbi:MAG: glycosyl hydrolase [Ignavibacteriales bacterium]|nr:MAG: glycosyl hydrolase [Ignavibacteriales bacterium]